MSVEASKWARMADVQKSSSKLVLINLAQLVRYDADEWTAFASIEYLVCVTHLNRKTVIEALARLRELGAIQDTGRRAGDNRSSIIYKLCPNAVPLVKLSGTRAAGALVDEEPQGNLDSIPGEKDAPESALAAAESDERPGNAGCAPTSASDGPGESTGWAPEAPALPTTTPPAAAEQDTAVAALQDHCSVRHSGTRRRPNAGPAATRLPATWELPAKWRDWALGQKPQWSDEKIDAMAATFSAYKRSQPGDGGTSSDWFESWRLWVFREWEPKGSANKPWQSTWSGIVAKGKKLGLEQAPNEPEPEFKARVFRAAGLVSSP
ncbi:hypothetical protein FOC84_10455 [Achromobacter pestifer]|uniref:Helix-turn-helix domain-containing protein n=1 Tax=Achromobacter pestifer TaxID=1353889 RepID=A0A7D4I799_9BURK|nr:hypothetical protein [Achromobacter pestifer]QKH35342.1 hypothetical protein FOC84_10455 [Achromobacter pestifer]